MKILTDQNNVAKTVIHSTCRICAGTIYFVTDVGPRCVDCFHAGRVTINDFSAVQIAEGLLEATQEEQIAAWQYLIDTGLASHLQGWFGRRATELIEQGICTSKDSQQGGLANYTDSKVN